MDLEGGGGAVRDSLVLLGSKLAMPLPLLMYLLCDVLMFCFLNFLFFSINSHLSSTVSLMSDSERDQIDQDAQDIIKTCSDSIRLIKGEGW